MQKSSQIIYLCILMLLSSHVIKAQTFGNEWIDHLKEYYKIPIGENGIYRVTRSDLLNAGIDVVNIDPSKYQIFHLGEELAIRVEGENDGTMDANDFIEFYAKKNDGNTDTPLYVTPSAQPHTYYNIYSDTSAYFLTYIRGLTSGLRMDEFKENNTNGISPDQFYTTEDIITYSSAYFEGRSYGFSNLVILGDYDFYEGWTGLATNRINGINMDENVSGLTTVWQPDFKFNLELMMVGRDNSSREVTIYVGSSETSLRPIETVQFSGDETYIVSQDILSSDISVSGNLIIRAGVGGTDDNISVSYIKLNYRNSFDLFGESSKKIMLQANPAGKSYIEVINPEPNMILYDITSSSNPVRIGINEFNDEINAIVDNTTQQRTLYIQSNYKNIPSLGKVEFTEIDPSAYNYLIVSSERLRGQTNDGQDDQVVAYASFRGSVEGGSYNVLDINIEELYDQFNYGLPSPLAIRNFCSYMYEDNTSKFLFLIGKSSRISADYYRQDPNTANVRHFVPTYGDPGGDVMFSSGLDGGIGHETMATGRINASEPDHIQAYLNKMIEEANIEYSDLRRKNLVQLSGGNSEQELNLFRSYVSDFADIAADTILGGESVQISKNNNTAVELINISDEINNGVMMVTFFGHSSGSVSDIEIGLVSDPSFGYDNKGRYPTFMVNGCLAGDFFSESESFGVDWILEPDLGASAFMAHSHLGFPGNLKAYTDIFYQVAFNEKEFSSLGVGQIKAETAQRYSEDVGSSGSNLAQIQLLNLQGDPAAKVFGADKPDYSVDENLIEIGTFDNEQLLSTTDSFSITFNIKNFGIYDDTPLSIQVVRTLADGSNVTYGPRVFDPILREDSIQFTIDNQNLNSSGANTLTIEVDNFNEIIELDEANNSAGIDIFLSTGSTLNLLPISYGIERDPNVSFFFQASDILTGTRDFDFQIDTTNTFNSPYLSSQTVNANVISQVNFNLDSRGAVPAETVFYWRTRFTDPLPDEIKEWVVSSFTYLPESADGWTQKSFDQLGEANKNGLTFNTESGIWDFVSSSLSLEVEVYGTNHPNNDFQDTQVLLEERNYFLSNSPIGAAQCRDNTVNFLAFQRQSSAPFSPIIFNSAPESNNLICGLLPQYIFNFSSANFTSANNTPIDYIEAMGDGDKVLIFSQGEYYKDWTEEFKSALESLGVNRITIDNLASSGDPFIFLGSKNTGTPAQEVFAPTTPAEEATLFLRTDLEGSFDTGEISTNKIGPARSWGEVNLDLSDSENPEDDSYNLKIYGISKNGEQTILEQSSTELSYDMSSVSTDSYPFLRLNLEVSDEISFSPPQLKTWKVTYQAVPEGVLLSRDYNGETTELNEGQIFRPSFTFWNISSQDYQDSLMIDFDLLNTTDNSDDLVQDSILVEALKAGDSINFNINLKTISNSGISDLLLEVNESNQEEIYTINNGVRITDYMDVTADDNNPIMDVLFDGIKIMDGDIVSPNVQIQVSTLDENQYLFKTDTIGINLSLKYPGQDFAQRISFDQPQVTWTPASEEENFTISYSPGPLEDGIYNFAAQVPDASGNPSGTIPYQINFEVINESTVTNFFPYPNPFSDQTRFVFTLTGSTFPDDLKIQIMTVTGRVVKEIFMDELGPIHIGNNLSEYAWDGRDNFGDLLANGVYLYRVLLKEGEEDFKHRQTSADKGFKNGFGKMYILR